MVAKPVKRAAAKAVPASTPAPLTGQVIPPPAKRMEYTPDVCEVAVMHMAQGLSQNAVAALLGVPRSTVRSWRETHPEFDEAMERGFALRQLWWEAALQRAMVRGDMAGIRGAEFALRAMDKETWNPASRVEHDGKVEGGEQRSFVVMIHPEDANL